MRVNRVDPEEFVLSEGLKHSKPAKKKFTKDKEKSRIKNVELIKQIAGVKKVLCIGARDDSEVLSFINAGFDAIGIDVTEPSKYVKRLDAHKMDYKENEFDFVYASHVLEHLYAPRKVMKKIRSISKYGVFIVLPIARTARGAHPTNFDMMHGTPDKYTVLDSDFDSFLPNHSIKHYKKDETAWPEPEFELMIIWD